MTKENLSRRPGKKNCFFGSKNNEMRGGSRRLHITSMCQLHKVIHSSDKGKCMKMACSSPPLLDDREDREEVDHCLVSIPRGCRVSPPELGTTASASIQLIASLTSWSLSGDGVPPLASVASSSWLN